jgi:hypothetical protein
VEHRQGPATRALAPVRKTIYSLKDLREILLSCNRRYLVAKQDSGHSGTSAPAGTSNSTNVRLTRQKS